MDDFLVRKQSGRHLSFLRGGSGSQFHAPPDDRDGPELRQLLRHIWRRKWLVVLTAVIAAAIAYGAASMSAVRYTSVATIMLDPRQQQIVAAQNQVVSDLDLNNSILESEVAVLRSNDLLRRVVDSLGPERLAAELAAAGEDIPAESPAGRVDRLVNILREGIWVSRVGDSYVIEIAVVSGSPDVAEAVANGLARTYIASQLRDRQRVAEAATEWLAEQVQRGRAEVEAAETRVEEARRAQLSVVGSSKEVVEQQLSELNQQFALARTELAKENARLSRIESMIADKGALAVAETQDSPFLTSLRSDRERLVREDARLSATLGPAHQDRVNIASEIARIDTAIAGEVGNIEQSQRNSVEMLAAREASLAQDVARLEAKLADLSEASLRLRQVEREAEGARQSYQELLSRLGETRAQVEIQRAEAKMINEAQVPNAPSAPRPKLMGAFGASLGLTGSLLFLLFSSLSRPGFQEAREIERTTGVRVLAVLPDGALTSPREVLGLVGNSSYSLLAERYRQLRTVLSRRNTLRGQGVLLLSSVPGEGKTTTAIALASFFARNGTRTVVLDLDTRRSELAREVGAETELDLADYLDGCADLNQITAHREDLGFDVISASRHRAALADGVPPERIGGVIEMLKRTYQVVIIDAPPVLAVPDGLAIAQSADAVLYLVRWRKTSRRSVSSGLAALASVGVVPTGMILTLADMAADPDGYARDYAYQ